MCVCLCEVYLNFLNYYISKKKIIKNLIAFIVLETNSNTLFSGISNLQNGHDQRMFGELDSLGKQLYGFNELVNLKKNFF